MTRPTGRPGPSVEQHLRAAQGTLPLVADLLDLQTVAPDFARCSLSSAASATLAALCRQHGEDLRALRDGLPAEVVNASAERRRARPAPAV